ncbi:site-2 protease family protein [Candidatus Kaiserbacteria bacterium CG10_big_fil_rev_8_21_14_0_10_44_10]|uniref:Site-2 protease family protein n=1 Tax=Candidatus Kaiserbacteria bacterium CG10_big_fil_rev_8_21_14_0_10_44_10 TaxID=1974606 RepID=A0A2H0UHN1_9BACT|nr:MAG: site-2 protease family protein [Candidatus Kaiserbacteria bacterium CG10_big_fil_rev_8_21_14_0_10_44_10]
MGAILPQGVDFAIVRQTPSVASALWSLIYELTYEYMEFTAIVIIVALIISIILHEMAHGYMADWLGDPTARLQGRLSPNPLVHIDPLGSVVIPALLFFSNAGILFGWAKPVPYNPYNLRDQKWGEAKVAFAGPAVNIAIALLFGMMIRFSEALALNSAFIELSSYVVYINILLAFFNMIPIPPLDGSKIIQPFLPLSLQMKYRSFVHAFERWGLIGTFIFIFIFINLFWAPFSKLVFSVFELITGLSGL